MWKEEHNTLTRTFKFKNFIKAFSFMTEVAIEAEKLNHHPNWSNEYNLVIITLSTHDTGNIITNKDRELALAIDSLLEDAE